MWPFPGAGADVYVVNTAVTGTGTKEHEAGAPRAGEPRRGW